jgi:hypothetical protein
VSRYRITTSTVAAAPIEAVWARVADITTWSESGHQVLERFMPETARRLARVAETDARASS